MLEGGARAGKIHPISERGRLLREVQHPLQPEMLVAEMAGELPPEVAQAVREHVAVCESCGARARALAAPYGVLSSLGAAPVSYIPDLRRHVRQQWSKGHFFTRIARAARFVGGGGIAGIAALVAVALVASLFLVTNAFQAPAIVGRSTSAAGPAMAAGAAGVVYVETNKILDVQTSNGATWPAAEVIVVDERTGKVKRSLPEARGALHVARAGEQPLAIALAPNGRLVYELTAFQPGGQALIAFDAHSGRIAFITRIALPGGRALPSEVVARGLSIGPDGEHLYLSLDVSIPAAELPGILVLEHAGAQVAQLLMPTVPTSVAEPPAPNQLPGVVATPVASQFAIDGLQQQLAANGTLAISPDGLSLYDAVALSNARGMQAVVVRRITIAQGETTQSLALPGDFAISALAASANPGAPLIYLARVGHDGQLYIFSAAGDGLTLQSAVPLGQPRAPAQAIFAGSVFISPTTAGTQAYLSADVAVPGTQINSHDLWLIDGANASIASHRIEFAQAGQALANWAGGAKGQVFNLRGSQIVLLPPNLASPDSPTVWLQLSDGLPMLRLIATASA